MRKQDAIEHYGSQARLAEALGIKQQSITDWGEFVPQLRQLQLERLTDGKLRADPHILSAPPAAHVVTKPA